MFGPVSRFRQALLQVTATITVGFFVFPLIIIINRSIGGEGFTKNYLAVIQKTPFLSFGLNTLQVAVPTIAVTYVLTMLAGYAFAKLQFSGRRFLLAAITIGLVLPSIALLVPLFIVVQKLGLFNSYWAVILPLCATAIPFNLLLVKNFMNEIQKEMFEAAWLDGCSQWQIFLKIVLPLSKPISSVVIIWTLLQSWNEYFLPLLFISKPEKALLNQVPAYFTSTYTSDTPKIFAALVMICLPVLIAYIFLQKTFERGLTAGALK